MNKVIILFAILIAAFAYVEATRCRSLCLKNPHSPIRCVRQGHICHKMRQCSVDEENCRRRLGKRPHLTTTSMALCRNIKGHMGAGHCAIKRMARAIRPGTGPNCDRIRCPDGNQKLNCYRSRKNRCRLLTPCQVERANCLRGRNRLEWVDSRRCASKIAGQKAKCLPPHKKG